MNADAHILLTEEEAKSLNEFLNTANKKLNPEIIQMVKDYENAQQKLKLHETIGYVLEKISEKFPKEKIFFEKSPEGEIFICCSSEEVYNSGECLSLIMDLKTNYLWPQGMHDILFAY